MASRFKKIDIIVLCESNYFEKKKMDVDNQDDDPQFVKVLETCLKMVIAETKQKLNGK